MDEYDFNAAKADMFEEAAQLFSQDDLRAFSIVTVAADGTFHHFSAYKKGFGLSLTGATSIAHDEIRESRLAQ
jgi:hypothetical protein